MSSGPGSGAGPDMLSQLAAAAGAGARRDAGGLRTPAQLARRPPPPAPAPPSSGEAPRGIGTTFLDSFHGTYYRNNKNSGCKHVRCFPRCTARPWFFRKANTLFSMGRALCRALPHSHTHTQLRPGFLIPPALLFALSALSATAGRRAPQLRVLRRARARAGDGAAGRGRD